MDLDGAAQAGAPGSPAAATLPPRSALWMEQMRALAAWGLDPPPGTRRERTAAGLRPVAYDFTDSGDDAPG